MDDNEPIRRNDPVDQLVRQDLGPLSVEELNARIAALEGEIARSKAQISLAVNYKASADALFRKG